MTNQKTKIINEIKEITGEAVAAKQDAAKLNFPKLIEKIRQAAKRGESELYISEGEMNLYDMDLLKKEGFSVWYTDMPKSPYDDYKAAYIQHSPRKGWKVSW